MRDTDEAIFDRYRSSGDPEDLRLLLLRFRESLTLFLCGYLGSMEDAEEVMLDAFAEAAARPGRFSGKSSFKTWLFAIGRNLAVRRLRKRRFFHEPLSGHEEAEDSADPPELMILKEEQKRNLYAALEKLNEDYRQTLFLLYFEDMSIEEAAEVMKKSVKQIYNLSHRGKQALKNILTEMGFEYEKY